MTESKTSAAFFMQITDSTECRVFSTKFKMSESTFDAAKGAAGDLPPIGHLFLELDGVESIRLKPYSCHIMKGLAWSWEEILEEVRPIFELMSATQKMFT